MSAAYLIAQLKVTNSENYKEYIEKVPEIVKKYGLVPKQVYPDTHHSKASREMNKYLKTK